MDTLASFNRRRRMKAESRQIPQKLATRLKFVFDPLRESLPLLFSANVDIYWKNYGTGKEELTNCPNIKEVVFGTINNKKLASLHASNVRWKARPFDFSWTVTLFFIAWLLSGMRHRARALSPEEESVRPLPNADLLSSDWFMRLCEGQPFSFEKILVMSL